MDSKLYRRYWVKGTLRSFERTLCRKLHLAWKEPEVYAGRPIVPIAEAQTYIAERVLSGEPFAAGRYGATELRSFCHLHSMTPLQPEIKEQLLDEMCCNAGFFPHDFPYLERFADTMREASRQMDVLCVWFNRMEDYVIEAYGNPAMITLLRALEPWYVEHPWSAALAGKKVLVIHPFKDTILSQYEKREKLFENPEIFPELADLRVVKAVQTIAGNRDERFGDWFEALDWMYTEAMKADFDVAIIGCGAYGFPLAAKLKEAGKQAIHMGGATQLLFGIKGGRWDTHPVISKLYNEHWVRPAASETPNSIQRVEGGCYW